MTLTRKGVYMFTGFWAIRLEFSFGKLFYYGFWKSCKNEVINLDKEEEEKFFRMVRVIGQGRDIYGIMRGTIY